MYLFTYFQEATGDTVDFFWKRIKEENLDYKRVNRFDKILKRGKIRGQIEYDFLNDTLVGAEQDGLITKEEAIKLGEILDNFVFKR